MTSKRLVLIVDDSAPLRSALRELLYASIPACSCAEASTGEEAVVLAREIGPDVVVMDLKLPGINGIVATRQIKALLPQTQVVMVSLYDAAEFQVEAAEAGVVAFLPKRVMHRELMPLLVALLDSPNGKPSEQTTQLQASGAEK